MSQYNVTELNGVAKYDIGPNGIDSDSDGVETFNALFKKETKFF